MDRHNGSGPGFDTLRVVLAVVILGFHGAQIVAGRGAADFRNSAFFPLIVLLVPLFFCLSGFLVTGSALRTQSVKKFLTNRALRIFPALTVEVVLSAFILGPIFTNVILSVYFMDKKFYSYFGNIIGRVRMSLPGVFQNNPIPDTVNASLWTLQPEFYCYLIMMILMATTIAYKRHLISIIFIVTIIFLSIINMYENFGRPTDVYPAHVVVFYFFSGVLAYHWRSKIYLHMIFFALSLPLSYLCVINPALVYFGAIPTTYIMIYLGLKKIPLIRPFRNGDYSYGIYLFNFPIQQGVLDVFPHIGNWWLLMSISIPLTIIFSAFSWHYIEKPALSLKNHNWEKSLSFRLFFRW